MNIENTAWAREFKVSSPVSYAEAIKYAQQPGLEVFIKFTTETGEPVHAIRVFDDPEFWMDGKPTQAEAEALCRQMGWRVVDE